MNPFLDDWLEGQSIKVLKSKRACLRFLRTAYSRCVSDFANKVRTDVTMADGGFRFHAGTPLPDLRQIASWMITHAPKQLLVYKERYELGRALVGVDERLERCIERVVELLVSCERGRDDGLVLVA